MTLSPRVVTVIGLVAVLVPVALAAQSRDIARPLSGTSTLSGVVVTDETAGRPVRRATVTLFIPGDARTYRQTTTDDAGRFVMADLPAGAYTLTVAKPGYVTTYFGARRAGSTIGTSIPIAEGQQTAPVTVRMPRGGVITGTVVDESGRPMRSVSVRVQRVTMSPSGERTVAAASNNPSAPGSATTDDRGVYRVYGLAAGDYVVSAQPRIGVSGLFQAVTETRQATSAELQWAERQIRAGSAASSAGSAPAASAGAPPARGATVAYANVYHPGVLDVVSAAIVTLTAGQERSGIDLRMRFVTTARVEGTVTDQNGQPAAGVQVTLAPKSASAMAQEALMLVDVGLSSGSMTRTGPNGTFSLQGVQPGQYSLIARPVPARGEAPPTAAGVWAATELDVDGRDVTGVALTLLPGMTVSGRLVFEGGAASPDAPSPMLRIEPVQSMGAGATLVRAQGEGAPGVGLTATRVIPGSYRVSLAPSPGPAAPWFLRSAMLNGRDVADVPFEVKPGENVTDLVVTLAASLAEISGVVYGSGNRPTSDLSIVVFTADRSLWFRGSRRLRAPVRPAADGRYRFTGLPAGEYYVAALSDFEPNDWFDPQFLEQVAPSAIKVTLGDGEKKVQDVRAGGNF